MPERNTICQRSKEKQIRHAAAEMYCRENANRPTAMMGIDSCGMLLSAIHNVNGEEKLNLVMLDDAIPAGAKLY